ncbi:threonine aldolase family protein [Bauldia sp.]|uniref:threonine aldolase family protein n=1 Tax=Bauldia sp. TaxID=2575872 RepID=UPI003BADBD87
MLFASDNWSGAVDAVIAAIVDAARETHAAYGADRLTAELQQRFSDLFEREVAVLPVGTGTAANALAISAFCRPGSVVFGHAQAHILVDETNAVALLGGGARIVGIDGADGKLTARSLSEALDRFPAGFVHHGQPVAVSLSQITELGLAYTTDEIAAVASVAKARGMAVHVDGARFAGAVAGLGRSPAELTWKAGVDVLSFGGTKNGCLAAEAIVFFDPDRAADTRYARQRIGHGFSKEWLIAAQLLAYLDEDRWLQLARHANRMAARLAEVLRAGPDSRLAFAPAANEVFAIISDSLDARLRSAGAIYYPWSTDGVPPAARPGAGEVLIRLVTSFQTKADDIDRLAAIVAPGWKG